MTRETNSKIQVRRANHAPQHNRIRPMKKLRMDNVICARKLLARLIPAPDDTVKDAEHDSRMQDKLAVPFFARGGHKQVEEPGGSGPVPEIVFFFDVGRGKHEDAVENENEEKGDPLRTNGAKRWQCEEG